MNLPASRDARRARPAARGQPTVVPAGRTRADSGPGRTWVPGEHGGPTIHLSVENWGEHVDLSTPGVAGLGAPRRERAVDPRHRAHRARARAGCTGTTAG